MSYISKRAKVMSDKPAYKEKIKTDNGFKWVYGPKHLERRNKEKKEKLTLLKRNVGKVSAQVEKDLGSDDLRTQAIAAIVSVIIDTGMRVGNEESAREGTFGASTLKVKHIKFSSGKVKFDFPGKCKVHQIQETTNPKVIKVIKELIKGRKPNDFVFEVNDKKIWDRAVNRYLADFGVSAKDLRGHYANTLMKQVLKDKEWKEALEETADIVGHESATLKNEYLDPDFVEKHEKLDKKAGLLDDLKRYLSNLYYGKKETKPIKPIPTTTTNIKPNVKTNQDILNAWNTLQPFLPPTAKLTSGVRTTEDQLRIIRNEWQNSRAYLDYPDIDDPTEQARILTKEYDFVVAGPGRSPHEGGKAFDVSNCDLDAAKEAIDFVSSQPELGVILKPLIERGNNAVHVTIISSAFKPNAITALIEKIQKTTKTANKHKISKRDL